jgi:pimeloyl-ACP methyl ester carboxylesterase
VTALAEVFPRSRTVRVGEVEAYVAEAGPAASERAPILLLHGNPDSHTVWSGVVARLAERHLCIAPDLPGFGRSRAPRDFDCSNAAQSAYVRDLVAALGLERFHLVVHDVGGNYGLAYASEHAASLKSLTMFNCNFFPDYRWHFWARVWRTRVLGEIAMAIANRPLFVREMKRGSPKMTTEYARHAYADFGRATRRMVLRWYRAADPRALEGWDTRLLAATANTPKQVLWGDRDPFIPAATADRFGAAVQRFADCGHWVMIEEPERAAAAIAALVERHP